MRYYVYILLDNRHPGNYGNKYYSDISFKPFYIGKGDKLTKNKTLRHIYHYVGCERLKEQQTNPHKCRTIKLLKEQNFEPNFIIVYENDDEKLVLNVETELIKYYGKQIDGGILTNIADGGVGGDLFKVVPGLREKLNKLGSERWGGEKNPNYKKPLSENFSHKYKKENGVHWNTGSKMSDSTKEKIKKHKYDNLSIVEMVNIETLAVVDSLKSLDAILKYGLNNSALNRCLNHGGTHKGYYWKYKDKELVLSKSLREGYKKPPRKGTNGKKVFFKYNINDEVEYEYSSTHDAAKKHNLNIETIRRKCKTNTKTTNIFRYEGSDYVFDLTGDGKKRIIRTDKDDNKVIFNSVTEAAINSNNGNPSRIVAICKGKNILHRGYKFEYLNKD
jgi:hypothetical protein